MRQRVAGMLAELAVAAVVAGCTTASLAPPPSSAPAEAGATPPASTAAPAALTFEGIRARPFRTPGLDGTACPVSRMSAIDFAGGVIRMAHGIAPFHFGPWDGAAVAAGHGGKTPWRVDTGYRGRLLVRGRRLGGSDELAFGFWPAGFGTPAEQPGVPVAFTRPDSEGRTTIYQPELDIEAPAGGRADGHPWFFPQPGCWAIQADGDTFTQVTVVSVVAL